MEICAQRSVGILPAHTLRAATPERRIATTPLATCTSPSSSRSCLRKSGVLATASVAVHPRAAGAKAECLRYPSARDIAVFV
jgi:hypothetical protein